MLTPASFRRDRWLFALTLVFEVGGPVVAAGVFGQSPHPHAEGLEDEAPQGKNT